MFPTSLWLTQHQCPRQKRKKQQRHKAFFFFSQHQFNVGLAERNCMEKLTVITWLALWDWSEFSTWRILSTQNVMCNLKTSYAVAWFSETGFREFSLKIKLELEAWEGLWLGSQRTLSKVCQRRTFTWPREHQELLLLSQSKKTLETPLPYDLHARTFWP